MGYRLILLGAPGAGKGTQAAILSKLLNIPTVSTGEILRQAVKDGTEVGKQVKVLMDEGKFAPDALIMQVLSDRLAKSDCTKGYILDGVPRTMAQAEALAKAGIDFDHVISLEVADEVIRDRMAGRRVCPKCGATFHVKAMPPKRDGVCDACGSKLVLRTDDAPETVMHRLETYHAQTEPLKGYYAKRGLLREVVGQDTIEATTAAVMEALAL